MRGCQACDVVLGLATKLACELLFVKLPSRIWKIKTPKKKENKSVKKE